MTCVAKTIIYLNKFSKTMIKYTFYHHLHYITGTLVINFNCITSKINLNWVFVTNNT